MNQEIVAALKKHPKVVERLKRVRDFIRKHPHLLKMSQWGHLEGKGKWGSPTCGTTACIAGWYATTRRGAKVVANDNVMAGDNLRVKVNDRTFTPGGLLTCDLGFEEPTYFDQGPLEHLMFVSGWPEQFKTAFRAVSPEHTTELLADPKAAARIAAKRITHFLRTGE